MVAGTAPIRPEDTVFGGGAFHEVVMVVDGTTGNCKHQFLNGPQSALVPTDDVFSADIRDMHLTGFEFWKCSEKTLLTQVATIRSVVNQVIRPSVP